MKKYLLPKEGNFYKANLHCHTNLSDGAKSPEEIKEIYKSKGYSIVAYTDHDVFIGHQELTDDLFLALNGFEVEIDEEVGIPFDYKTCHICFIACTPDNLIHPLWHRSKYLSGNAEKYSHMVKYDQSKPDYERHYSPQIVNDMIKTGRENDFFITYNHPTWSLENYADYMSYDGMHAMEMFNGVCLVAGYEDYNPRVYDDMLRGGKKLFCIGGDDNHNKRDEHSRYSDCGVAYTMIKAQTLEYSSIIKALQRGDFYASIGPHIHELYVQDGKVFIKCSEADRIILNCANRRAAVVYSENDIPLTEASFDVYEDCGYFRLTVVDKEGKRACTNAYFIEDLSN